MRSLIVIAYSCFTCAEAISFGVACVLQPSRN
jgi:hypothetical protein